MFTRRFASVMAASLCSLVAAAGLSTTAFAASPPVIEEEYAVNVSATSATLRAKIDPQNEEPSTFRFEYDTSAYESSAAHGHAAPSPEGGVAAGFGGIVVEAHIQGLQPGATYHYRVVASSAGGGVAYGEDRSFTTQQAGGEFALPDNRMWEMVSPQNKHGAQIEPITGQGGLVEAAAAGGALTYVTIGPPVSAPEGNTALEYSQMLSRRGAAGWSSQDIATEHDEVSKLLPGHETEYMFFSGDLSAGLVEPEGATPLPPLEEGAERTIYLRNDATCSSQPKTCFLPLVTKSNVPPGAVIGPASESTGVEFVAATPDLSHVVLASSEALTEEAVKSASYPTRNLYEWTDGKLQLVSILPPPNAVPATAEGENASLGFASRLVRNAISDDGSRIVWEAGERPEQHLYLRDMTSRETVQLDVPQPGVGASPSGNGPVFQAASDNDSRVFFTDEQRLTPDSRAQNEAPDLYVFEPSADGGPLSGTLTDLTVDENAGESAAVRGEVLGTSKDGTYVYFAASGALSEHAIQGSCHTSGGLCNLYMAHYNGSAWERPVLISVLSHEDEADWQLSSADEGFLGTMTSRVSPNGEYLAFMSDRPLTQYDNHDANSGAPDEEVYVYHAGHGAPACASCDPTGARPVGVFDPGGGNLRPLLVDHVGGSWDEHWLAASVPGWTPASVAQALYQSRYLSNDGRLFFDSPDALVPADTNGEEDVYEFEPAGIGSCTNAGDTGSEVFSSQAGGCVALISSGTSSEESAFLDASEDGGDVFFLTTAQLSSEDVDSALDIYDAHECTGASPCVAAPVAAPPCRTVDACREAPAAQPTVFGAPASALFSGAGNLVAPAAKSLGKPSTLPRRKELERALAGCRKRRGKHERAGCERRARRRYGGHKGKAALRRRQAAMYDSKPNRVRRGK
jgi:hypothetical protein